MHPLWQIKQNMSINGKFYIDRCNTFGGCSLGSIFIAFNSLVVWIAKNIKQIKYLANYVNDSSGCGFADEMTFYAPYHHLFPQDQTTLLNLWDELGIPHKENKQVFRSPLPVIGINVNTNRMSLSLPEEAKRRLCKELKFWSEKGKKEKVKHWYRMGGWVSWGLNIYPVTETGLKQFLPKIERMTRFNITNMDQQQYP